MSNEDSPSVKEEQLLLCSKWPNCPNLIETKRVVTMTAESLSDLLDIHRRKRVGIICDLSCFYRHPDGGCFIDGVAIYKGVCPYYQDKNVKPDNLRTDIPGGYWEFTKTLAPRQSGTEQDPHSNKEGQQSPGTQASATLSGENTNSESRTEDAGAPSH